MSRSNDIANITASVLDGVTATEVGLGNVTNESKATMFTSPTFTGTTDVSSGVTLPSNPTIVLGSNATFPAGHIIGRLAHKVDRTRRKYTNRNQSTWYDDYTELNFTVTPSSSSSKLWFNGMISFGCNSGAGGGSFFLQYLECDANGNNCDATNQINGDDTQTYGDFPSFAQYRWSHSSGNMEYHMETRPINAFMDSYSGTKTYKLRYRIQINAISISFNKDGSDSSDTGAGSHSPSGLSMIQVFEIAQ